MHGFSDCNICRLLDLYFLRTALRPGGLRSGHGLFVHSGGVRCDGGHVPWSAAASAFPWSLLWRIGRFAGCCICRHVQQLFLPRRSWFVGCDLCLFLGSVRNWSACCGKKASSECEIQRVGSLNTISSPFAATIQRPYSVMLLLSREAQSLLVLF